MSSLKILAVGSAFGSVRELLEKVKTIDAKHGKFEIVLATGDFLGSSEDNTDAGQVDELLEGKLEVPIQVFIMQGDLPLPQAVIEKASKSDGQLCHNVFLLGKSQVFTTAHGLRIACLSGKYAPEKYYGKANGTDFANPYFTASSLKQLLSHPSLNASHANLGSLSAIKALSSSQFIDILLTHTWPSSIMNNTSLPLPQPLPEVAPQLDEIVRKAKPRYHFTSCGGKFWEREPYCWAEENNRTSRFVCLGAFGNKQSSSGKKERWFYAFSISPGVPTLDPQSPPSNATINPFTAESSPYGHASKRTIDDTESQGENYIWGNVEKKFKVSGAGRGGLGGHETPARGPPAGYVCKKCNATDHFVRDCPQSNRRKPPEGYTCRVCGSDQHYVKDCPVMQNAPRGRDRHRGPAKELQPDECWFCLSNPRVAKHLVVAIGTECYVVLPKGQVLPTQVPSPSVPVPGGGHVLIVPVSHYPTFASVPTDLALPIISEAEQFKSALRACFAKYNASPVMFEVARLTSKGGHAHIQVVPIPNSFSTQEVEDAFRAYGESTGVTFQDDMEEAIKLTQDQSYLRVELPNGKKLLHFMQPGVPFDLQFGRVVVANLLGLQERIDWKACVQSEDEERTDATAFKSAFNVFDPSR